MHNFKYFFAKNNVLRLFNWIQIKAHLPLKSPGSVLNSLTEVFFVNCKVILWRVKILSRVMHIYVMRHIIPILVAKPQLNLYRNFLTCFPRNVRSSFVFIVNFEHISHLVLVEALENVWNLFKVKNKNTRTTSLA